MQAAVASDNGPIGRSKALDDCLARAHQLAVAQGHPVVALEHLLFALLDDPDSHAIFDASAVSRDRLSADVSAYIGRLSELKHNATGAAPQPGADLLRILQLAAMAARQSQRRHMDGAIVLAAIIGDGNSPAAGMLKAQGLTFDAIIKVLSQIGQPPQREIAADPARAPLPSPAREHPAARIGRVPEAPSAEDMLASVRARVKQSEPSTSTVKAPAPPKEPVDRSPPPAAAAKRSPAAPPPAATAPAPDNASAQVVEPQPGASAQTRAAAAIANPAPPSAVESRPGPALAEFRLPTGSQQQPPHAAPPSPVMPSPAPQALGPQSLGPQSPGLPPPLPPGQGTRPPLPSPSAMADAPVDRAQAPAPPPSAMAPAQPYPAIPSVPPPPPLQAAMPPPAQPQTHMTMPPAGVMPPAPSMPVPQHQQSAVTPPHPALAHRQPLHNHPAPAHVSPPPPQPAAPPPQAQNPSVPLDIVSAASGLPASMRMGTPVLVEVRIPRDQIDVPRRRGQQPLGAEAPIYRVVTVRLGTGGVSGLAIEPRSPETIWLGMGRDLDSNDFVWQFVVTPTRAGRFAVSLAISGRSVSPYGVSGDGTPQSETFAVVVRRKSGSRLRKLLIGVTLFSAGLATAAFAGGPLLAFARTLLAGLLK